MVIHINKKQVVIIRHFCIITGSDIFSGILCQVSYFTTCILPRMSCLVWLHSLHAHTQHHSESISVDARIYVYQYPHSGWL